MRLISAIRYDLKLQFRHGFYFAYLIICIIYTIIVRSLPAGIRAPVLTMVILTDPSVLGFFFLGGIVFLERGQKILEGIFITPLRMGEYIWSKVISLTLLALLSSFLISLASVGPVFNPLWLFLGVVLTSILYVFLGFTLVAITESVNRYLITSPLYVVWTMIPLLDYLKIVESPWFYLIPTQASLTLIDAAFAAKPPAELLLAVGILIASIALACMWASKWFYKYIVLRTGAAA